MQSSSPLSDWGQVLAEIAKFLGSGSVATLATWLLMRRKTKAEVQATDADAARNWAEARQLDSKTVNEAYDRIEELWNISDAQREQIRTLSMARDKQIIEIELLEDELKWLKGVMAVANVKLSDYDYLRRKRDSL